MFVRPVRRFRNYLLDRMVLRPSRQPIDFAPQRRRLISRSNGQLEYFEHGDVDEGTPPDALVLKFPGTAGRAERSTRFPIGFLPTERVNVWTWNPPGYGGSQGRASLASIARAAMEFWEHSRQFVGPKTPTLLCGNSLGCVTALRVAAEVSSQVPIGLLLRNPPPLIPVVQRVADRYPAGRLVRPIAASLNEPMNAVVTATKVQAPAVFLQSELDTLVPPALQQQVIDAYGGEKRTVVLHGLCHSGLADESHEEAIAKAIGWLWNEMQTATAQSAE